MRLFVVKVLFDAVLVLQGCLSARDGLAGRALISATIELFISRKGICFYATLVKSIVFLTSLLKIDVLLPPMSIECSLTRVAQRAVW